MKITKYFKLMHPEGSSELFFIPEGDTRVWHVLNTYSSQFSKDAPEYNVSECLFTSDSVTVKNNHVGINRSDFIKVILEYGMF